MEGPRVRGLFSVRREAVPDGPRATRDSDGRRCGKSQREDEGLRGRASVSARASTVRGGRVAAAVCAGMDRWRLRGCGVRAWVASRSLENKTGTRKKEGR